MAGLIGLAETSNFRVKGHFTERLRTTVDCVVLQRLKRFDSKKNVFGLTMDVVFSEYRP